MTSSGGRTPTWLRVAVSLIAVLAVAEGTARILASRLPEGLVLLEMPIAGILQVSRAPVQRALRMLENEGLIHRFTSPANPVGIQMVKTWTFQPDKFEARLEIELINQGTSNISFGGENFNTLFATCGDKVYKRRLKVKGANAWDMPNKPAQPRL